MAERGPISLAAAKPRDLLCPNDMFVSSGQWLRPPALTRKVLFSARRGRSRTVLLLALVISGSLCPLRHLQAEGVEDDDEQAEMARLSPEALTRRACSL